MHEHARLQTFASPRRTYRGPKVAQSRLSTASDWRNTPGMRVPQLVQQPFFSRFDITECHERVITTCLHPGQIVFAPSEKMLPSYTYFSPICMAMLARAMQRLRRGGRLVVQLEVGMKRGEVQRHIVAQILQHPVAQLFEFRVAVVQRGDDQVGDLEPNAGLVPQPLQRVEHRLQMRQA